MDTPAPTHDTLTIGQLARKTGVGVETIRFYERQGLVREPARRPSGYRQYPRDEIRRLRFIRRAKELGFTLREIQDLLALTERPDASCAQVRDHAARKLEQVRAKIRDLQAIETALGSLITACPGDSSALGCCPVLSALDQGSEPTP